LFKQETGLLSRNLFLHWPDLSLRVQWTTIKLVVSFSLLRGSDQPFGRPVRMMIRLD